MIAEILLGLLVAMQGYSLWRTRPTKPRQPEIKVDGYEMAGKVVRSPLPAGRNGRP